jgi:hypothetical protein
MPRIRIASLVAALLLFLTTVAMSVVSMESFDPVPGDPDLVLGTYTHPAGGKTLDLTVGIGSGVFRSPFDLLGLFAFFFSHGSIVDAYWTVGDRGPNFQCEEAPLVIQLDDDVACPPEGDVESGVGRIYPLPNYSPSIFRVVILRDGTFRIVKTVPPVPLRTANGTPVTGLPNPLTVATTEVPRDGTAKVIAQDASSIDAEAIVRAPHFGGRFLIGEENGPSIVEVRGDGRIIKRFVPAGTERDYTNPPAPSNRLATQSTGACRPSSPRGDSTAASSPWPSPRTYSMCTSQCRVRSTTPTARCAIRPISGSSSFASTGASGVPG